MTPTSWGPAATRTRAVRRFVDGEGRRRHVPVAGEVVLLAAHLGDEHLLTVDRDLDAVGELQAGHVAVEVAHEADGELVLGVLREVVTEAEAASSAQAQAVHFVLLRIVRGHAIGEPHDLGVGADGQAAHTPGGGQVLFEQRRRDAQHAGDVVEAVALVIGRQEVHDVDLQVEQVAHGVAGTRCGSGGGSACVPGPARSVPAASIRCSSEAANPCSVASSGRGMPTGGIMPPRSFMITFSQTSEWLAAAAGSSPSSDSPPVRVRALWQVTQVLLDERLLGRRRQCLPGRPA